MKDYTVVFHFDGLDDAIYTPTLKSIFISEFVKLYNQFCEFVNPNYESWNTEFNMIGGSHDDYVRFIRNKLLPFAKRLNGSFMYGDITEDEAQFICRFKHDHNSTIYFTLREKG